jgi:hypothetical protein
MEPIRLSYSESLIRRAVLAFWFRVTGWRFFIAFALVLVPFTYLVAIGDRSWWVGVFGSILVLAVLFAFALYFVHYRASITKFRAMKNPEATFEAGEERFRVCSDIGSSVTIVEHNYRCMALSQFLVTVSITSTVHYLPTRSRS